MTSDTDPFAPVAGGPPTSYGVPPPLTGFGGSGNCGRYQQPPLNTYAVLAPILAVLVPPAGVAVGHLALPQIKRTGQRGWLAAVCGLATGYLMCAVLAGVLLWLLASGGDGTRTTTGASAPPAASTSVLTSMAPAPARPRDKLDLNQAAVGMCVEIEKRDESNELNSDDALDLYHVSCQHRVGVYTVVARVSEDSECNSTYVAAPNDHEFAVCLNRY